MGNDDHELMNLTGLNLNLGPAFAKGKLVQRLIYTILPSSIIVVIFTILNNLNFRLDFCLIKTTVIKKDDIVLLY